MPGHSLRDRFLLDSEQRKVEAKQTLLDSVAALDAANRSAFLALTDRNAAIWVAKESGVSVTELASMLGMTRDGVYKALEQHKNSTDTAS